MDSNKIDMFFAANGKKFKPVNITTLREKMKNAPDEKFSAIQCVELKDPSTMFWISLFVGELGVDSFMMGKTGRGILKLCTLGVCGIFWLIDVFKISDEVKDQNYMDIMAIL